MLLGASSVCGTPMHLPLHHTSPFHSPAPFSTVLPGGCPACDTRALQGALLCLEHLYAAFPLPRGVSFNGSRTLLENAADTGGLVIALKVTHILRVRISFCLQNKHSVSKFLFYHFSCKQYKAFWPSHCH